MIALILAVFALLRWTNPPQPIDSVLCVQARAPGDTITRAIYASTSPLVAKRAGTSGAQDSAYISVSVANVVGPASYRLFVLTHGSGGWSAPSNAANCFYAARDTAYLGPNGWERGPALLSFAQALGDPAWPSWQHQEVYQASALTRLCLIYHYACRRGVRDTLWCAP